MSYLLCGRKEVQNGRSDPYVDGTSKKSSVHKWQNLAILDRTLLSIKQCPGMGYPLCNLQPLTSRNARGTLTVYLMSWYC